MRKTFALFALVIAVVTGGCRDWFPPTNPKDPIDTLDPKPPSYSLEKTRWCLVSFTSPDGTTSPTVDAKWGAYMMFTPASSVSGFGGCNGFKGTYAATANGGLSITDMSWTDKACLDGRDNTEGQFLFGLGRATSYRVVGDQLTIFYTTNALANSVSAINLVACSDPGDPPPPPPTSPLVGPHWCFQGFQSNSTNTLEGVDPSWNMHIVFDEKAHASGSGGCNTFGADYSEQNGTLHIANIVSTKIHCDDRANAEGRYFTALAGATSYTITGDKLQIRYAGGGMTGVLVFQSCYTPNDTTGPVDPDPTGTVHAVLGKQFDLPYAWSAFVDINTNTNIGMEIRLTDVSEGRCPEGANCFWEGRAKGVFEVVLAGRAVTKVILQTPGDSNSVVLNGYKITMLDLKPHPVMNAQPVAVGEYIATMIVTRP